MRKLNEHSGVQMDSVIGTYAKMMVCWTFLGKIIEQHCWKLNLKARDLRHQFGTRIAMDLQCLVIKFKGHTEKNGTKIKYKGNQTDDNSYNNQL